MNKMVKNKKIVLFILVVNLSISLFSYEWDNKIEIFSYDLFNRSENAYSYILKEYFDTIDHKNRNYLLQVMPKYINTGFADLANDKFSEWYDLLQIKNIAIGLEKNKQLLVFDGPYFVIEEIEEIQKNLIKLETQIPKYSRQFFDTDVLDWKKIKEAKDKFVFLLKFDGDYIYVYENDISDLFAVFCKISSSDIVLFKEAIKTNNWGNISVTWPRHADGSCDYDENKTSTTQTTKTTLSTNVTQNKTMLVNENLKLRSGEATSTQVITVMSAGAKVKILELGKTENIDGINSNWVKVEIISGNDRNGNKLKSGMTGWCYGGYLE